MACLMPPLSPHVFIHVHRLDEPCCHLTGKLAGLLPLLLASYSDDPRKRDHESVDRIERVFSSERFQKLVAETLNRR